MALIKCPECGKEISDQAPACIHCGFPLNKMEPKSVDSSLNVVLKRSKGVISESIIIFFFTFVAFGVLTGLFAFQIPYQSDSQTIFVLALGMALITALFLVSIAGLVLSMTDRTKNNNRLEINLIEYDDENNVLVCRNFKDEILNIKPESVRYLDGNHKVYLYYYDEKKKKKVFPLGFANKNDIKEARTMLKGLKTEDKVIK